jgi:hypothetical protein
MKRAFVALAVVVAAALVVVGGAGADPVKSHQAVLFEPPAPGSAA